MSMMCCKKCGHSYDTDFNVEVCRYGFILTRSFGLIKTDNPKDCVCLCDNCFEGFGYPDEEKLHSLAELNQDENDRFMERLWDKEQDDKMWEEINHNEDIYNDRFERE